MTSPQNEPHSEHHSEHHSRHRSHHRARKEREDRELASLLILNTDADTEPESPSASANEEEKPRHKRVKKIVLRVLLILLIVLVSLILIVAGILFWMYHQGKSELLNDEVPVITPPKEVEDVIEYDDGERVTYNGVTYEFNKNVTAVLVVGVDKEDIQEETVYGQNGQADTLFLATLDTENGDIHIIPLSRETMVDVDQYAVDGSYLGVKQTQLCLAYAYGSNGQEGCENVVRSVSRLLYGVPINSYIAIDMEGVEAITDTIGGVPLKALEDVSHPYSGRVITRKGETVTLNGKDALTYMRYRGTDAEANNRRMQRLKQFFTAFINRSGSKLKEDISLLPTYYDTAEPYTVTDINLSKITYLVGCTLTGNDWKNPDYHSISGTSVEGEKHNEFYADTTSAYEAVLAAFYTPVEETAAE